MYIVRTELFYRQVNVLYLAQSCLSIIYHIYCKIWFVTCSMLISGRVSLQPSAITITTFSLSRTIDNLSIKNIIHTGSYRSRRFFPFIFPLFFCAFFCAPQIFSQIFTEIFAQREYFRKYFCLYFRNKNRNYLRCKKYRKYLRLYWRNAQITANIGANICANICGEKGKYTHRKYLHNYLQ